MRQFTHEERVSAASAVASQTGFGRVLREETNRMVAESWAQGEVIYCVSNQYAIQLQCELAEARAALSRAAPRTIYRDLLCGDDDVNEVNFCVAGDEVARNVEEFAKLTRKEDALFTPDEIETAMDKNLAAGLRQLADALEAGTIDGHCIDCKGHGFTKARDPRAHVMLRIDLAAPVKQTFLGGESRQEFENDRMGQTGADNARKMFGEKEKS